MPACRMCNHVALLAEGVDRNSRSIGIISDAQLSPSSQRAWIEIDLSTCAGKLYRVALLAEGVDRNRYLLKINKAVVGRPPRRGRG